MLSKLDIFQKVLHNLNEQSLEISSSDDQRPWGGFYVIKETDAHKFVKTFFSDLNTEKLGPGKLSPKILIVEPGKKLSWQYHHRRAELWTMVEGDAQIVRSHNDEQTTPLHLKIGEMITLEKGERHRLVGGNHWSIVAEIWMHTEPDHPSDEEDIIRLDDDFGR